MSKQRALTHHRYIETKKKSDKPLVWTNLQTKNSPKMPKINKLFGMVTDTVGSDLRHALVKSANVHCSFKGYQIVTVPLQG